MTNTLTITVRDKSGVNMGAMMSDLGNGLFSTSGAGTEATGTMRVPFVTGALSFTDSVRTFPSENPGVWADWRDGARLTWNAEAEVLLMQSPSADTYIAFGTESGQFTSYGRPATGLMSSDAGTMEFISFAEIDSAAASEEEAAQSSLEALQDALDRLTDAVDGTTDIFGGPSWNGLMTTDASTMEFSTPEGDALMTTDAGTMELRIGYEVNGGAVQATSLTAREDGSVTWRASYETPQDLGLAPGDGKGKVKDALAGAGDPLDWGTWSEPVSTLTEETRIVFNGGRGNDKALGGSENDTLKLGKGNDVGLGLDGRDTILGGKGNDIADGGGGKDTIKTQGGSDVALGGAGNDKVIGGGGNDIVSGDEGNDTLKSGGGNDVVIGGAGRDRMNLGGGDDLALLEAGDSAVGGAGSDTFLFMASGWTGSNESGPTTIEGGDAGDRVVIWTDNPSAVITAIGSRSLADTQAGNLFVEELDLTITGVKNITAVSPSNDLSFNQAIVSVRPAEQDLTESVWNMGLSAYFSDAPMV